MFAFWIIWHAYLFCNTRFEIRPFALLPTNLGHRQRGSLNHPVLLLTLTIFHTLLLTLNRHVCWVHPKVPSGKAKFYLIFDIFKY